MGLTYKTSMRCRRCVRVWESVQPRLRDEHGSAEHSAVQQRAKLRVVLRDPVRERRQVVPAGLYHRDSHQLLPAQQCPSERRRRLVQSTPGALRPIPASVPTHCPIPRRHRPCRLPQVSNQVGRVLVNCLIAVYLSVNLFSPPLTRKNSS